jgi:hypothetical protein
MESSQPKSLSQSLQEAEEKGKNRAIYEQQGGRMGRVSGTRGVSIDVRSLTPRWEPAPIKSGPSSPFAELIVFKIRDAMVARGDRVALDRASLSVSLMANSEMVESLSLPSAAAVPVQTPTEPFKRQRVFPQQRYQCLSVDELVPVFGTDWSLVYDGRVVMSVIPPITFSLNKHENQSRKRGWVSGSGHTPWSILNTDTFYTLGVKFGYAQTIWDSGPTALPGLLSRAKDEDGELAHRRKRGRK